MRLLLLSLLFSLALASCTLKLEDFRAYDEKTLYSTDFSQDEGKFRNHPGGTDGITEIADGVLHIKGGHMNLAVTWNSKSLSETIRSPPFESRQ